jgi:uncharacterized protein (TIGR02466 family)
MKTPSATTGMLQAHWPVPMATHRFSEAAEVNAVLARVFTVMRATDPHYQPGRSFYASSDDLLQRVDLPEFAALIRFIAQALQSTVKQANAGVWPQGRHGLQLELTGVWFQIQNGDAFHDIHTHGNCSWSGVYYVQIDPQQARATHTARPNDRCFARLHRWLRQGRQCFYIRDGVRRLELSRSHTRCCRQSWHGVARTC